MSIKTSNTDFKTRIRQQIEDPIMRKAVANAQQRIGANRQKMVDELGHWEEWRDRAAQIRDHVLSNLDAYLYQLSEKVTQNGKKWSMNWGTGRSGAIGPPRYVIMF